MTAAPGDLPLHGVRVISFEQFGAAPYATMFLADFGAEVLKVEMPEGDFARRTAPLTLGEGDSLYFQSMNLNKKSIVIDLREDGDRAFFLVHHETDARLVRFCSHGRERCRLIACYSSAPICLSAGKRSTPPIMSGQWSRLRNVRATTASSYGAKATASLRSALTPRPRASDRRHSPTWPFLLA